MPSKSQATSNNSWLKTKTTDLLSEPAKSDRRTNKQSTVDWMRIPSRAGPPWILEDFPWKCQQRTTTAGFHGSTAQMGTDNVFKSSSNLLVKKASVNKRQYCSLWWGFEELRPTLVIWTSSCDILIHELIELWKRIRPARLHNDLHACVLSDIEWRS